METDELRADPAPPSTTDVNMQDSKAEVPAAENGVPEPGDTHGQMETDTKRRPLEEFDHEIEVTARHNNARRRKKMVAHEQATNPAEQIRLLQRQLEKMQQMMREQEDARAAPPPPINELFIPVLNHEDMSGSRINANNFELEPELICIVQHNQYGGRTTEDPNAHLFQFLEICSTVKMNGISDDAIRVRLFPFSLRDIAKLWYQSLGTGSVDGWEGLAHKFLHKFFPPGVILKLKREITQFRQFEDEPLYEAWERFQDMLWKCPNHGFGVDLQVCIFYNGCTMELKKFMDVSAGGSLLNKGHDQAITIIENMTTSSYQWSEKRQVKLMKRAAAVDDNNPISKLAAQLSTLNTTINSRFNALSKPVAAPFIEQTVEDVNYINQWGYGNANYRGQHQIYQVNRSNLSYGNFNNALQSSPDFSVTNKVIDEENKPKIHDLLMTFMEKTDKFMGESQARVEKLENTVGALSMQMKMFEKQLGQIATLVGNQHQPGQSPRNTVVNRKE